MKLQLPILGSVLALLLVSTLCHGAEPAQQWEYKVFIYKTVLQDAVSTGLAGGSDQKKLEAAITSELEKILNQLGSEGWEFCSDSEGAFIFKRQKTK